MIFRQRERLAVAQQEATQFRAEGQTLHAPLERLSPPEQVPAQGAQASKVAKAGARKTRQAISPPLAPRKSKSN